MSGTVQPWSHRWHDLQRRLAANAVLTGGRPTPPPDSAASMAVGIVRAVGTVKVGRTPWVLAPAGSWLLRARIRD